LFAADRVPEIIQQACNSALSEKGVAYIALPTDVATENVEAVSTGHPIADTETENTRPLVSALNNALSFIQQAEKIVVLAGIGAIPARQPLLISLVMLGTDFPYGFKHWTSKFSEFYPTVIAIRIHYLAGV
jgi:thiamine pyrophosphate-dependent acetolactate synthase large subunit-like protein